jgi:TP901-1 family phage major tail protein
MAKQKGRSLLVKIGDGGGTEVFATLCGLTAKSLTINNEEIDVTTPDCTTPGGAMWTEVLDGVKRISVSGNGFFEDSAQELRANTVAMLTPPVANFQLIIPAFGTFAGAFFMSSLEWGGEAAGGVTYAVSLASTGVVTFTAS